MGLKRVRLSLWMLGGTVMICAALWILPAMRAGGASTEVPAPVTLARVETGRVERVLAVTARLRYESEYAALAPCAGVVEEVYVSSGERVRKDQALFKLSSETQESILSAALNAQELTEAAEILRKTSAVLDEMTVRAAADGVVQKVAVVRHGGVMQGTAGVVLSAGNQRLAAGVGVRDAAEVRRGMPCRISLKDEFLCGGTVLNVAPAETDSTTGQTIAQVTIQPEKELEQPLGAALDVDIILASQDNVNVLPVEALDEEDYVWWVADGRCYRTQAGVVMLDEMNAWVALPEGIKVVLRGEVAQGQRIREVEP